MTAFALFSFFASFLISSGQCFVLPFFSPKAAGACYQTPPKNNGDGPADNALLQKLIDQMESMENKMDHRFNEIDHRFNEMDHRFNEMDHRFNERFNEMDLRFNERFNEMDQQFNTLNQRTGLLVEEAARKFVTRNFGEKFSRSFTIKSTHDVITLIAQANTKTLPDGDRIAATKAVKKVVDFLYPLLPVFLEAAVYQVVKTVDEEAVLYSEAFEDAQQKIRKVQEELKAAKQMTKAKLVQRCGIVLGAVKELGAVTIDGESKTDKVAREKKMNLFTLKLERIQKSLKGGKHGLATCEGAGILMCNALVAAGRAVWEGGKTSTSDWIREEYIGKNSIFDFKQEMECDCCPFVEIASDHCTLEAGEIKTNISLKGQATNQMREQIQLLEFGLWCIFGKTIKAEKIVKKGRLFVFEAKANQQSLEDTVEDDGISIFVYKVGH